MAVALLGEPLGRTADVTVVYLVLVFGWSRAPGQWAVWVRGVSDYHQSHRPWDPATEDEVAYASEFLVDDAVLIEPLLGLRPWTSAATWDRGCRMILPRGAFTP